jgi:hypothetical protein
MQIQNRYLLPSFVAASPADHALVSYIQALTGQFRPIEFNDFVHAVDSDYRAGRKVYRDGPAMFMLMFFCCETPSNESYAQLCMFIEVANQIHNKLIRSIVAEIELVDNVKFDDEFINGIWHRPDAFKAFCEQHKIYHRYHKLVQQAHQIEASFAYRKYFLESQQSIELAMNLMHGEPKTVTREIAHPLLKKREIKVSDWCVVE